MRLKSATIVLAASLALLLRPSLLALDLDLRLVGACNTSGSASDVAVSVNYVYVADAIGGLQVIDVSNPANPVQVGGYDFNTGGDPGGPFWYARSVAASGRYAYVTADRSGDVGFSDYVMQVIDVSNPTNCVVVGGYYGSRQAWAVAVSGNYAYVANLAGGLQVIDVSNPATCARVGGYNTSGDAFDVAVSDNYAYVADYNAGLQVIDVSNPANPQRVGGYGTSGAAVGVAVLGQYAYVITSTGLEVIDVSNPANPQRVGSYGPKGYAFGGVAVVGQYAYVAGGGPLQVIDVSNPANPRRVGSYDTSGYGVAALGSYAYLAAGGLQLIDVGKPANPQRVGAYAVSGFAFDVAVSGSHAYLLDNHAGLQVIDISNLADPQRVGGYNDSFSSVTVSTNHAYVVGENGLEVIDINDPTNPQRLGGYAISNALKVAVSGNYTYVVEGAVWDCCVLCPDGSGCTLLRSSRLHVIDISNPANPRLVGTYDDGAADDLFVYSPGFEANDLAVSGGYAYLTGSFVQCAWEDPGYCGTVGFGMLVINVTDAANPLRVGSWGCTSGCGVPDPYNSAQAFVAVADSFAYVTGRAQFRGADGLYYSSSFGEVLHIGNPAYPQKVGSYPGGNVLAVSGNYAYSGYGLLQVIDISDPAHPRHVGGNPNVFAQAAIVANGKVFVAAGEQGLVILHEYQPIRFEGIARQNDGVMQLHIAGPPGVPGHVQRSADLRTWTDWLPVEFGESTIEISDPEARTAAMGFYRIAVP